ncbi:MAG: hypothetical protein CVU97_00095 [Firmicutes bacterium HGW-Firmicutes-21]|nr:MAG: hypothetical protein CVU97_00095 [Firmicutes bacterium HGW-Firmicutes-21]
MKLLKFFIFCTFIAVLLVLGASAASGDISPAIGYLRSTTTLDKCSIGGETVSFSQTDFAQTIGTKFDYIVISSLPEDGVLTLNGIKVLSGQTIPVSSLNYLKFIPDSKAAKTCKFTFTTRAAGWEDTEVPCVINVLESINFSPIATDGSLTTIQNVTAYGSLTVVEPDDDDLTYKIVKFPRNGHARIGGDGSIIYTPREGYSGSDNLVYTATDKYGNLSGEATVSIKVEKNQSGILFEDLKTSPTHYSAIKMAEKGIMTYTQENGAYIFTPDEKVTRIDYLVMLMTATELDKNLTAVTDTAFLDDSKLSAGRKGYLARALSLGLVDLGQGIFKPLDPITKAEAAVMTAAALSLPELAAKQTFVDIAEVPDWAFTAVASATNVGLFAGDKGYFSPNKVLTKSDVAVVLSKALDYIDANNLDPLKSLT